MLYHTVCLAFYPRSHLGHIVQLCHHRGPEKMKSHNVHLSLVLYFSILFCQTMLCFSLFFQVSFSMRKCSAMTYPLHNDEYQASLSFFSCLRLSQPHPRMCHHIRSGCVSLTLPRFNQQRIGESALGKQVFLSLNQSVNFIREVAHCMNPQEKWRI